MKKLVLLGLALTVGLAAVAQRAQLKPGIPIAKKVTVQKIGIEPEKAMPAPVTPKPSGTKSTNIVNVITIGTSANANGYGYDGGQKTMVWADNELNAVINVHRMGPGTTPPSFSGYIGIDLGVNRGVANADWTNNRQIYAANLNAGGTYYADAGRYPQGGIYNPAGNTSLANAYAIYFAPNLSNAASTWGGYSYGVANLGNAADTTKHLYWFAPPLYTYIPDGMDINQEGTVLVTDIDQEWSGTTFVGYKNDIILWRGLWNNTTKDVAYTNSLLPLTTSNGSRPSDDRVAFAPDGQHAWIFTICNNGGATQVGPDTNYYPVVFKSNDGGATWSDPIAIQLDGPNGITGVKNFLSDYRIAQLFTPPLPTRDEIPYTTAWDGDIVVDKWGNPHIGVVIGVCPASYSIATGDSALAVFDIYSTDKGLTWQGVRMGCPKTFDGAFGTLTEYNRTQISASATGDFVFVTYGDTDVPNVTTNTNPDVYARGFNLLTNKITNANGNDIPTNVTFLSEITQNATFHCTSRKAFTNTTGGGHTIPIVAEILTNSDPNLAVSFKYISDFQYVPADYTISVNNPPFPVGVNEVKKDVVSASLFPNPVKGIATLKVNLVQGGNVTVEISNLVGQRLMNMEKGNLNAGSYEFTINGSSLPSGVYFYTVKANDQKITNKMVVQ